MDFIIFCPNCHKKYKVTENDIEKIGTCRNCNEKLVIKELIKIESLGLIQQPVKSFNEKKGLKRRQLIILGISIIVVLIIAIFMKYNTKMIELIHDNETIYGTIEDIDGNIYKTVKIGDQWWMAENLKVQHYKNGDKIYNITKTYQWSILEVGAYCSYDNNSTLVPTFGLLYNWHSVNDVRGLAPEGWHIPTKEEFEIMFEHLGDYEMIGGKLKSVGTEYWRSPNEGATNESGFSALPGGCRSEYGNFQWLSSNAFFWTNSKDGYTNSIDLELGFDVAYFGYRSLKRQFGASVRCVKD